MHIAGKDDDDEEEEEEAAETGVEKEVDAEPAEVKELESVIVPV
jgi:hypothetical protein